MRRVALALAALALAGCEASKDVPPPPPAPEVSTELPRYGQVPPFRFVDQTGSPFGSDDLAGRVYVVDFMFTHCSGICVELAMSMRDLQQALADLEGVRLVSISVDPERDTPERLTWYAANAEADPERWRFLTGDREAVVKLSRDGFFLGAEEEGSDEILHSRRMVLVDGTGRVRGYYDGTDDESVARLAADARRLAAPDGAP